ncbi:hypothetical protein [Clostridium sp. Marseille-P2415]|uniref:hypothetical protein n=1 Tax=Clostridium sp. Marseille-P2415 TaxID=1805471 RepID=UPI00111550EA|nr:hypothetical protein [Clostridium sp. Marseille-P2415]
MLKDCPLYAILSGFNPTDTPGVGTFYDFFSHLWQSDQNNLSPKERFPKPKVKKGEKTGDKTPADLKLFLPAASVFRTPSSKTCESFFSYFQALSGTVS